MIKICCVTSVFGIPFINPRFGTDFSFWNLFFQKRTITKKNDSMYKSLMVNLMLVLYGQSLLVFK